MMQPINRDGKPEGLPRVLWMTRDRTNKVWKEIQSLYTYNKDHQVCIRTFYKLQNLKTLQSVSNNFVI